MTSVSLTFSVALSPDRIWPLLSDFKRWDWFFVLANPEQYGWGDRFEFGPTSGAGTETRLEMMSGQKRMQDWAVEEWSPSSRLKIKCVDWHDWFFKATRTSFEILITPVSSHQSTIQLGFDSEFSAPILGLFLNAVVPMKKDMTAVIQAIGARLQNVLLQSPT